jgi:hypothetical protein
MSSPDVESYACSAPLTFENASPFSDSWRVRLQHNFAHVADAFVLGISCGEPRTLSWQRASQVSAKGGHRCVLQIEATALRV